MVIPVHPVFADAESAAVQARTPQQQRDPPPSPRGVSPRVVTVDRLQRPAQMVDADAREPATRARSGLCLVVDVQHRARRQRACGRVGTYARHWVDGMGQPFDRVIHDPRRKRHVVELVKQFQQAPVYS